MRFRWLRAIPVLALVWAVTAVPVTAADVQGIDAVLPRGLTVSGVVRDAGGNPVAGASVALCDGPDGCYLGDSISDADGAYAIRGVDPGLYVVSALPPQDANLLRIWFGGEAGSVVDPSLAVGLDVAADVAAIDLTMPFGVRLTGHVRSPEGDPVAGVLMIPIGDTGFASPIASDANGLFQVVGLKPGATFRLEVRPPERGPYPRGYAADGSVQQEYGGSLYAVGDSDTDAGDITLVPGRTISGQLLGTDGAAVSVLAYGSSDGGTTDLDPFGHFVLRGIWPGEYTLLFIVTEGTPDDSMFPYGLYNGQDAALVSQYEPGMPVDLWSGDVAGISAPLPVLPAIDGTITDAAGPLGGARVAVCSPDYGCAYLTSASDGHYRAINLPDSSYTVQAGAMGRVTAWYAPGDSVVDPAMASSVVVAGSSISAIDVELPPGSAIRGHVTGPDGEPVSGANVTAIPESGGISEFGPGGAITDADGSYALGGLVDGTYRVSFSGAVYSGYLRGYWSPSGLTADYNAAGLVTIGAAGPVIVARSPESGASGVGLQAPVRMTFSVDVVGVSKATIELRNVRTGRVVKGSVRYSSKTLTATFRPEDELARFTTYEVVIRPGISDHSGNALAPESWTFRTGMK